MKGNIFRRVIGNFKSIKDTGDKKLPKYLAWVANSLYVLSIVPFIITLPFVGFNFTMGVLALLISLIYSILIICLGLFIDVMRRILIATEMRVNPENTES